MNDLQEPEYIAPVIIFQQHEIEDLNLVFEFSSPVLKKQNKIESIFLNKEKEDGKSALF